MPDQTTHFERILRYLNGSIPPNDAVPYELQESIDGMHASDVIIWKHIIAGDRNSKVEAIKVKLRAHRESLPPITIADLKL